MPSAPDGDWRSSPHMQCLQSWRQLMGPRADELYDFLWNMFRIQLTNCPVCERFSRNMQSGFGQHVAGQHHFKHLRHLCYDNSAPTSRFWQGCLVRGGAYRFNHVDGTVEICRGKPPENDPENSINFAAATGRGMLSQSSAHVRRDEAQALWPYCCLFNCWAVASHVTGKRHRKEASKHPWGALLVADGVCCPAKGLEVWTW